MERVYHTKFELFFFFGIKKQTNKQKKHPKIFEISFLSQLFVKIPFSFFSFFSQKDGLFFAAQNGSEQIIQFFLEKGEPNVDLADQVFFC